MTINARLVSALVAYADADTKKKLQKLQAKVRELTQQRDNWKYQANKYQQRILELKRGSQDKP